MPPRPRRDINWIVVIGGLLIFFGYLFFVVGDVAFLGLRTNPTSEQYLAIAGLYIAAEMILGIGFLVALIGLAIRRRDSP